MIKECNFKSRIRHGNNPGRRSTPSEIVCPSEDKCILYQIYKKLEKQKE